jgi:TonB family protein
MPNRSHLENKDSFFSASAGQSRKNLIAVFFLSVVAHGLFFIGVVQLNRFDMSKPLPRVIQVDLVSFVPGPAGGQASADADVSPEPVDVPPGTVKVPLASAKKKMPAETIPKPVATIKPDISLKSKPKNLKELVAAQEKKTTPPPKKPPKPVKPKPKVDPEEALKKAREKLAEQVEKQNEQQISEALNRLQAAVETKGNEPGEKDNPENALGPGGAGAGTGLGKEGYSALDLYKLALQSAIEQNWVFNDMLARMDQHLEVRVMIKILKSGEIRDIAYETKSGNRYLDESAKKAIKRANPLPKLPAGMTSFDLVVGFTPKGLK